MKNREIVDELEKRGADRGFYPGYYSTVQIVLNDGMPYVRIDNRGARITERNCLDFLELSRFLKNLKKASVEESKSITHKRIE